MVTGMSNAAKTKITYKRFLFLLLTLMSLFMLLVCFLITYAQAAGDLKSSVAASDASVLSQSAASLEDAFLQLSSLTEYLSENEGVVRFATENAASWSGTKTVFFHDLERIATRLISSYSRIGDVMILTEGGGVSIPAGRTRGISLSAFRKAYASGGGLRPVGESLNQYYMYLTADSPEDPAGLAGRCVFASSVLQNGRELALVLLIPEASLFQSVLGDPQDARSHYLLDESFDPLYASGPDLPDGLSWLKSRLAGQPAGDSSPAAFSGNGLSACSVTSMPYGWTLAKLRPEAELSRQLRGLLLSLLATLVLLLVVILLLAARISERLQRPFRELISRITGYRVGEKPSPGDGQKVYYAGVQFNLLYNILLIVLIPAAVYLFLSFRFTWKLTGDTIVENSSGLFREVSLRVDGYVANKLAVARKLAFQEGMQQTLSGSSPPDAGLLAAVMDEYLVQGNGSDVLCAYDTADKLLYSNVPSSISPGLTFSQVREKEAYLFWNGAGRNRYGELYLELYVRIVHLDSLRELGHLRCLISEAGLENRYRALLQGQMDAFLTDSDGLILSHSDKNLVGQRTELSGYLADAARAGDSLYFIHPMDEGRLRFVGRVDGSVIRIAFSELANRHLYILGSVFFFTLLLSYIVVYNSSRYLRRFHRLLERYDINHLEVVFPEESRISEISELGAAFNEMTERTEELLDSLFLSTRRQTELEKHRRDAELVALQTQITPHFLYNTFDCISWMVKCGQRDKAVLMISALSEMFRYVMRSEGSLVEVEKELEYVRQYVRIMEHKYEGEITFSFSVPPELLHCKTLKLSVQPLVENAVSHGVSQERRPGRVSVSCREENGDLLFIVEDDGAGIPPDALARLRQELEAAPSYEKVGLRNIQNRVRLLFGQPYGILLESRHGEGTRAVLRIPRVSGGEGPCGTKSQTD